MAGTLQMDANGVQPSLRGDQRLKLGLFAFNCNGGVTMSQAPTSHVIEWPHIANIAKRADELGFDAIVPVARWRGFGGATNYNGRNFETFTWAAGVAAITKRAMTFATVHVPLIHPIVAAKMSTTIDHISGGRFGMNLVMGWFRPEMEMFGVELKAHDDRYGYGSEWLEVMDILWTCKEPTDFTGRYFDLKQLQADPKPIQKRPILINAGSSPAGLSFAGRHMDFNFANINTPEKAVTYVKSVKAKSNEDFGRSLGVLIQALLVVRDTEAEAESAWNQILACGDYDGAQNFMDVLGIESQSFNDTARGAMQREFVAGAGMAVIKGTPASVVRQLAAYSDAGVDGILIGFIDYAQELEYFGEKVLPLMERAKLRHSVTA
jgi:FMNH2-dependent dimethyl sulfone monooxygenase